MKKRTVPNQSGEAGGSQHLAAIESSVFDRLPNVVKHCCITKYEDGSPRKPGWITIKTLGSAWVVQVKEPDSALSLTCTQQSLDDALALADVLLGSDEAPWEPDPFLAKNLAPKGKGK